jgi:hypothetical protein
MSQLYTENLFKGKASLVLREMLKDPKKAVSGSELAYSLNIAPEWSNRVLKTLEKQRLAQRSGYGMNATTRLLDPSELLKRWLASYRFNMNQSYYYLDRNDDPASAISKIADKEDYLWSFAAYSAANAIDEVIYDVPLMIYLYPTQGTLREARNKIENIYELVPVLKHGNLTVLDPYQKQCALFDARSINGNSCTSPLQLFLDLYWMDQGEFIIRELAPYWKKNNMEYVLDLVK